MLMTSENTMQNGTEITTGWVGRKERWAKKECLILTVLLEKCGVVQQYKNYLNKINTTGGRKVGSSRGKKDGVKWSWRRPKYNIMQLFYFYISRKSFSYPSMWIKCFFIY